MSTKEDPDKAYMTTQNKNQSFEQVYLQYVKPVYYAAYGILKDNGDAEDIAHDVFLAYWQMKEPEQIRDLRSYLLKTARNKALTLLRKKGREEPSDEIASLGDSESHDGEDTESLAGQITKEIHRLPSEERQIFIMHVNAGLGFRQIAKVMEMSVPTVYRRYREAVRHLWDSVKE